MAGPLCACSPVILDPADPTGILGQGKNWDLVAKEAAESRVSLACVSDVRSWDVQVGLPAQRHRGPTPPHGSRPPALCPRSPPDL